MLMRVSAILGLCLVSTAAFADRNAADKCAANLNTDGRVIYSTTAAQVQPGVDLRALVKNSTETLVKNGTVSMGNARPAAEAAGKCLSLINS